VYLQLVPDKNLDENHKCIAAFSFLAAIWIMFQRAVLLDIVMTLTDNFAKFHGKLTSAHKYFKAVIATFL